MSDGVGSDTASDLAALVARLPEGWSQVRYADRRYGLTCTTHTGGRSVSVYAEELGGSGVISANVWLLSGGTELRPCEMPAADVLDFLTRWGPVS